MTDPTILAADAGAPAAPPRTLGPVDAACVVIGAIIGVGIFFTPSQVATLAGSGGNALTAWAVAGLIALLGALAFAELGARYNRSGAQYEVLRDAYGSGVAFAFVFCNATGVQAGAIGVIASICVRNAAVAAGVAPPSDWWTLALASTLVAGVTLANVAGARWGARIQNLTVFAKVATLLAITALAAVTAPHASAPGAAPAVSLGATGVLSALVPAFFAYGGWQHALWISGEVRDPERTLPRAILAGTVLVVVVYLLANVAYLRLLGHEGVAASKTVAADAVGTVMPNLGRQIIAGAVAVSALGVLNAQLLTGPRLVYTMAKDGRFFRVFGKLDRRGTPAAAIALLSVMALVVLLCSTIGPRLGFGADSLDLLLSGSVSIDGVFFALTGVALIILRRRAARDGQDWAGFRTPAFPLVPALFVVGATAIVAGAFVAERTRPAGVVGLVWIGVAFALYAVVFATRRTSAAR